MLRTSRGCSKEDVIKGLELSRSKVRKSRHKCRNQKKHAKKMINDYITYHEAKIQIDVVRCGLNLKHFMVCEFCRLMLENDMNSWMLSSVCTWIEEEKDLKMAEYLISFCKNLN